MPMCSPGLSWPGVPMEAQATLLLQQAWCSALTGRKWRSRCLVGMAAPTSAWLQCYAKCHGDLLCTVVHLRDAGGTTLSVRLGWACTLQRSGAHFGKHILCQHVCFLLWHCRNSLSCTIEAPADAHSSSKSLVHLLNNGKIQAHVTCIMLKTDAAPRQHSGDAGRLGTRALLTLTAVAGAVLNSPDERIKQQYMSWLWNLLLSPAGRSLVKLDSSDVEDAEELCLAEVTADHAAFTHSHATAPEQHYSWRLFCLTKMVQLAV